jgi:hypothetical protein
MIKEALEYIVGLKDAHEHVIDETTYTDKKLIPVFPNKLEDYIKASTLTSLVNYIKNNVDECTMTNRVIVHIVNPTTVEVKSPVYDMSMKRNNYIDINARVPRFNFGDFYDAESFNIALQSKFIQSNDRDIILKVVGNLKDEAVRTIGDDGVSQSVTTKTGVATVENVKVPNPVTLKPYRTFIEVEQPESKFIFRMKDGGYCALFQADGGAWENEAISNIKEYLNEKLSDLIESGQVIILA